MLSYTYRGGWDDPSSTSKSSDARMVDLAKFDMKAVIGTLRGAPETTRDQKPSEVTSTYLIIDPSGDPTTPDAVELSIYVSSGFGSGKYRAQSRRHVQADQLPLLTWAYSRRHCERGHQLAPNISARYYCARCWTAVTKQCVKGGDSDAGTRDPRAPPESPMAWLRAAGSGSPACWVPFGLSHGSLYPALRRMQADGLIVEDAAPRGRRSADQNQRCAAPGVSTSSPTPAGNVSPSWSPTPTPELHRRRLRRASRVLQPDPGRGQDAGSWKAAAARSRNAGKKLLRKPSSAPAARLIATPSSCTNRPGIQRAEVKWFNRPDRRRTGRPDPPRTDHPRTSPPDEHSTTAPELTRTP